MKRKIIYENQRGLLFVNGKLKKVLMPGRHWSYNGFLFFPKREIETVHLSEKAHSAKCELHTHSVTKKWIITKEVPENQIAFHYVNGRFSSVLGEGVHAFWKINAEHTFADVKIVDGFVSDEILHHLPSSFYSRIEIKPNLKAVVYLDNRPWKNLEEGVYYFWRTAKTLWLKYVDSFEK